MLTLSLLSSRTSSRHFGSLGVLTVSLLGLACTGNIGGDTPTGPQPPPDVDPIAVPASPDVRDGQGSCVAMREGEQLLSVSPEGHAWLAVPGAGNSSIRVLDALDLSGMTEVIQDVELTELAQVQAWTGGDAAVLAAEGLWRLEELARIQLTPPEGFANPAVFCGDPGLNGSVLANGLVYERRADGQWWGWEPTAEGDSVPTKLLRFDGECQSKSDIFWMTSADGTLWSVEADAYTQPVRFEALVDAAVTHDLVAVLESDRLWMGPETWQPYEFPGKVPDAVSASNGFVWMMSGSQLLRFDGEGFIEVSHAVTGAVESVNAYTGGVWLVGGDEICHHALAPVLRVDGIRSYGRSSELLYDFTVATSDVAAEIVAELNGDSVELRFSDMLEAYVGRARLDHAGWHELRLSLVGQEADARTLLVKRIASQDRSWEEDIRPISELNCAIADCHGSNPEAPPLDTRDAWANLSDKIRTRVIEAGTMPPPANQTDDWSTEQVSIIAEWLEGGMQP